LDALLIASFFFPPEHRSDILISRSISPRRGILADMEAGAPTQSQAQLLHMQSFSPENVAHNAKQLY
jgi:hypothetical protein